MFGAYYIAPFSFNPGPYVQDVTPAPGYIAREREEEIIYAAYYYMVTYGYRTKAD